MRAKCVRVLPQIRRAQDSPTEERSNRVSRPTVRLPGFSSPREPSYDTIREEKVELKRWCRRCKPRKRKQGWFEFPNSPITDPWKWVISQHVIKAKWVIIMMICFNHALLDVPLSPFPTEVDKQLSEEGGQT